MVRKLFTGASFVVLLLLLAGPLTSQSDYQVIVNAANPESAMARADVSKLFLKKTSTWSSGIKVVPVDQAGSRSVRDSFTQEVHGKSVAAIKAYWQKLIFSGRATPPAELASDTEVLTFVRREFGGVGYVSATAALGSGIKVLNVN
jgi:hypothetical protein